MPLRQQGEYKVNVARCQTFFCWFEGVSPENCFEDRAKEGPAEGSEASPAGGEEATGDGTQKHYCNDLIKCRVLMVVYIEMG